MPDITPRSLFESASTPNQLFSTEQIKSLPPAAQRYINHSIQPDTPLAPAVYLEMHGTIKLNRWGPFKAKQAIVPDDGMIWKASVRMFGLPIIGSDRLIDGKGSMQWKMLGFIPVMKAAGPDITRSTAGRMAGELIWLPSALMQENVKWSGSDDEHVVATLRILDYEHHLHFTIDSEGRLKKLCYQRWGDPDQTGFRKGTFMAIIKEEGTFGGYTIPIHMRAGWSADDDDELHPLEESHRIQVDKAEYY